MIEYFPEPSSDVVTHCAQCGKEIYARDEVVVYDGEIYCDSDCIYDRVKEEMTYMPVEEAV